MGSTTRQTVATDQGGEDALDPTHAMSDDDLRRALAALASLPDWPGRPEWEAIGGQLAALAERDSRERPRHAGEFQGAYVTAGVDLLRRSPDAVIAAARPWGLLAAQGRSAGRAAVAGEVAVGLTDRDPVRHRVRPCALPKVGSYERLVEQRRLAEETQ
jgi:hypothetical protein